MSEQIDNIIRRIKELEEELETQFREKREEFHFTIETNRVRFAEKVALQQRKFKTGFFSYLATAKPLNILTAPIIYSGFIPFLLLDLFLSGYQWTCFPIYGIPKVKRSTYMLFDREDLPYLNFIEKFNCFYCAYGNGLAAYAREISARTEQYWCPIKHARRIKTAHTRYHDFFEYGDAEAFQKGLERLRKSYKKDT